MAKVKYRVREYTPHGNMPGAHSLYAEAVVDNVITTSELAKKIEDRHVGNAAIIQAILWVAADVILQECAENNRVQLETSEGGSLVSIYPKVQGSISDAEVQADSAKYGGATVATKEMLTPARLRWSLGATVGINYSRQFDQSKSAVEVPYNPGQTTADPDATTNPTDTVSPGTNPATNPGTNPGSDSGSGNGTGSNPGGNTGDNTDPDTD